MPRTPSASSKTLELAMKNLSLIGFKNRLLSRTYYINYFIN